MMADSQMQNEPSPNQYQPQALNVQSIENLIKNHDVNLATQLSIDQTNDSTLVSTSADDRTFSCQTNTNNNSNGDHKFPLAVNQENLTKCSPKLSSWHDLLKHLRMQRIVKNIQIFNKLKRKQQQPQQQQLKSQQFPLDLKVGNQKFINFPSRDLIFVRECVSLKKVPDLGLTKFPLKVLNKPGIFLNNDLESSKVTNICDKKDLKNLKLEPKIGLYLEIMRNLKKSPEVGDYEKFPLFLAYKYKAMDKFPLKSYKQKVVSKERDILNPKQFPLEHRTKVVEGMNFQNWLKNYESKKMSETVQNEKPTLRQFYLKNLTKFPCDLNLKKPKGKFPQKTQYAIEYLSSSSSLSTTQRIGQNIIDHDHQNQMSQVQDALIYKEENPLIEANNSNNDDNVRYPQTPPQTQMLKTTNDADHHNNVVVDDYDDDEDFQSILATINSINNNIGRRPKVEIVGHCVEKIERIQNAIASLFETIQNSFRTNHDKCLKDRESSHNASIEHGHDHDQCDDKRFALTPPMSVTSVRNTERTFNHNNNKYSNDLGDLSEEIVEQQRSDVRDSLAEAVVNGVTKESINNRTGSFLVKSEEPPPTTTSPKSPDSPKINESSISYTNTSLEDYTNTRDKLPKYNVFAVNKNEKIVNVKNNLEFDRVKEIDILKKLKEINDLTSEIRKESESSELSELTRAHEMTVTRSKENEQKKSKANEILLRKENIDLCKDLDFNEMKYKMNRVKGALPSSASERSHAKYDGLETGNTQYGRHAPTNATRLPTADSSSLNHNRLGDTSLSHNRLADSSLSHNRLGDSTLSHNRLASSPRAYDSSYTPRTSLKSDINNFDNTTNRRSSLSNHLPTDSITKRSVLSTPVLNETLANRTTTPSAAKTSNDITADTPTTNRRPSLGALRNTQSTSLLSVDLPRYNSSSALGNHLDPISINNRAISIDSPLGNAFPERTRLRRQRRLRTHDSQDEPEDPIERLNRLKARISASLSEVKGVLKQYSTDAENENEHEAPSLAATPAKSPKEEESKEDSGPVAFRFVKKVRRRSFFNEEEEKLEKDNDEKQLSGEESGNSKELSKESDVNQVAKPLLSKDETDKAKLPIANAEIFKDESKALTEKSKQAKEETKEITESHDMAKTTDLERSESKLNTALYTLKEEVTESLPKNSGKLAKGADAKADTPLNSKEQINHKSTKIEMPSSKEEAKAQAALTPNEKRKADITFAHNEEIKAETKTEAKGDTVLTPKEEIKSDTSLTSKMEANHKQTKPTSQEEIEADTSKEGIKADSPKEETKGAIPKAAKKLENFNTSETAAKTKRKVVIKSKDPARRASLAAVEGSKIEPPVKVGLTTKIQRRPSDSEAVIKKKLITAKINTSGIVEEVTPKPKIVKVKKSSVKSSTQLATEIALKEKEEGETTNIVKGEDHYVKSKDKDNKSIHNNENRDVQMPNLLESQQNLLLQNNNNNNKNKSEIARQTNLLLPTQLVIDEVTASLNEKTIENSVLTPRQQQQQQQQQQNLVQNQKDHEETQKQATIKSTTTNSKSNDLQQAVGGAMLENLTTVLSSSSTSKANGQIKRENVQKSNDDLSDLLQQESVIVPKANIEIKGNDHLTKVKDLAESQASLEKSKVCVTGTIVEQQQKSTAREDQQVFTTSQTTTTKTDVAVVVAKNEVENKHVHTEDVKAKNDSSLKQPCADESTPTSTPNNVAKHHQHQQDQLLVKSNDHASITIVAAAADTKTLSSPHISISSTTDITPKTSESTKTLPPTTTTASSEEQTKEAIALTAETMPELKLAPAPVQTAEILPHPEHHKKKIIIKKIIRQNSADKSKTQELLPPNKNEAEKLSSESPSKDETTEECSESTEISEISEISTSLGSEELANEADIPKKERKVKKKVIIKRQKRRLSIGDSFFLPGVKEEPQNTEIETLEKAIAYVSDEDDDHSKEEEEAKKALEKAEKEKKPLKSCILHKEYNIGDEVLYAERFKKTQIKWRRGRIKERITSISYLLEIDGKDVSSHINYLKKFTGRKVSFGGKEYLEIDYEQLQEEEERAERVQKRTYSIWNMV